MLSVKEAAARLSSLSRSLRTPVIPASSLPVKYPSVKPEREKTRSSSRISPGVAFRPSSSRRR